MFLAIYWNELKKNLKSIPFYIFTALIFLGTFIFISSTERGSSFMFVTITKEFHNAPIIIARMLGGYSILGVLFTMVLIGRTVAKDFNAKIHDFFFTIPMTKFQYLGGRFFAGFTANLLIFIGNFIGFELARFRLDANYFGPFDLGAHLLPVLLIVIPNLILIGSLFFSLATLTRKMVITYIGGVGLFMAYALSAAAVVRLDNDTIKILVDPFGITAMNVLTKFWTITEMNTNPMPISGIFLLNRAIWLSIGLGIMIFTLKKFRFVSVMEGKKGTKSTLEEGLTTARTVNVLNKLKSIEIDNSISCTIAKFSKLVEREFKRIFFHPAFLILTFMAMSEILMNFILNVIEKGYEVYPFTSHFLKHTMHIWIFMIPLTIVFSGVLVWRERDHKSHELYDTLPIPDWMSFGSKLTTLVSLQFIYVFIAMICGILTQLFLGFTDIEPLLYLKGLFGIEFMKYFFMAVMFMFIQNLSPNKYVGFFLSALYFLGDIMIVNVVKYNNPFLRYGNIPKYIYSNLNGYGHYGPMIIWYIIYWLFFAGILLILTTLLWRKGNEVNLKYRIKWVKDKVKPIQVIMLTIFILGFLSTGYYIYYNRTILNKYLSEDDMNELKANYEKNFGKYENAPQPRTTHVDLNIDLYPQKREMLTKGSYLLKNKTDSIIREIYLNLSDMAITKINKLEFTPTATLVSDIGEFGFRIFRLEKPLNPGDEMKLDFDIEVCIKGFTDNNPKNEIAADGTCVIYTGWGNHQYFPGIGLNKQIFLKKKEDRKKYGLTERPNEPALKNADPTIPYIPQNLVTYNALISTNIEQTVVSNGDLIENWQENNRNYFHFKSDKLIHDEFIISSGKYEVTKDKYNDIDIEIYYNEKHSYNIDAMIDGLKTGLDFNGKTFSPYPYSVVRIVEIPDYMTKGGARSQPTVFIWRESAGFIRNLEKTASFKLTNRSIAKLKKEGIPSDICNKLEDFKKQSFRTPQKLMTAVEKAIGNVAAATYKTSILEHTQKPESFDRVFGIAAHELGHQWWAYIVTPAYAEGVFVLTETMCQYVWEMCYEKHYSTELTRKYLEYEMDHYLRRRKRDTQGERPLLYSYGDQSYLGYPKSSVVMYALQDYLGEDVVGEALGNVVEKFGWREDIFPTSIDVLNEIKTVTPDSLQYFVTDMFEKITLYENKTKSATYEKLDDGRYKVNLTVEYKKFYADSIGVQTEAPLNDYVYIGILGEDGKELYMQKHKFEGSEKDIEIVVSEKPEQAGIDPYVILIDRKREDNLIEVKEL